MSQIIHGFKNIDLKRHVVSDDLELRFESRPTNKREIKYLSKLQQLLSAVFRQTCFEAY